MGLTFSHPRLGIVCRKLAGTCIHSGGERRQEADGAPAEATPGDGHLLASTGPSGDLIGVNSCRVLVTLGGANAWLVKDDEDLVT